MAVAKPVDEWNQRLIGRFEGFSKLSLQERYKSLVEMGVLGSDEVAFLSQAGPLSHDLAEKFIENVIGFFQLPLGVATNFVVDEKAYVIPMAVEETSIIAAASKTAKWVREQGQLSTEVLGNSVIGQIQIGRVQNADLLKAVIAEKKQSFIADANEGVASGLVNRGGGVKDIDLRFVNRTDGHQMAVIHVYADTCDAMGANIVNQICEYLKGPIEVSTGEQVSMCILSNLVDSKVTRAKVVLRGIDESLAEKIEEASIFAQQDPYRAATNNKGVLNGIDPILIATGNDWRAVEAGCHAYAARSGKYSSLTKWYRQGSNELVGEFEAPIVLGIVGGVTRLHPTAQICLRILGIERADELSRICAAVGLVQNLGALKALTTVGIIEGHMKLHIKNLTLGAGANDKEIPILQRRLEEILSMTKRISLSHAVEVLREIRSQKASAIASSHEHG